MTLFVLDASIAAGWAFPDEENELAAAVMLRLVEADEAICPPIWPFEVANAFVVGVRKNRFTEEEVVAISRDLRDLAALVSIVPVTFEEALGPVTQLAYRYRLTVYDASYLHLAVREGLALATVDRGLRRAAVEADVPLIA